MIEGFAGSILIGYLSPVALFTAAVCMLVLRAGASRVFFDIVGTFTASKLIKDADSAAVVFEALYLDAITGIQEAGTELGEIFNSVTDAVVPIARELAEAEIQLEKFLDTSQDITEMRDSVEAIGVQFAFAGDEAMEAAAKMAQISGVLGPGSLAVGTQIGMEFGLISGMETEAAMQRMINLQQQTKFMTENLEANMTAEQRATQIRKDSMVVLDQLNTIENRSAATMEQITFVMNQFASQAHLANEEIRSMAALSAVMIETGEEQGKGGRALKMMYARLGSDIGGARTEMERLGVAVIDSEGNMRPLSSMLKELEDNFNDLDGAQQQNTAQIIAGNRHYTRFLKLLTNLDRVKELELEAALALFPAMDEIERRRDSELFQLEQAEAKVRNLSASLGDKLLPAMTEITNKQAQMTQGFLSFTKIPLLGKGALMTFELVKAMTTLVGPMVATIINFKNMSISLKTHVAITKALNTQQELMNNGFIMGGAAMVETNRHYDMQQMVLKALNKETAIRTDLIKQNLNLFSQTDEDLLTEQRRIEGIIKRTRDEVKIKERKAQLQEIINERTFRATKAAEEQAESNAEEFNQARKNATQYNNMTIGLSAMGSAFMLVGKSQTAMNVGMTLNTAAMGLQIAKMVNLEKIQKSLRDAALAHAAANKINTESMKDSQITMMGLTATTKSLIATIKPLLILTGVLAVAFKMGKDIQQEYFASAKKAAETTSEAIADMGNVADIIGDVNSGNLDLNDALTEQKRKVEDLRRSNSSMMSEVLPAQEQYLADLIRTQDILDRQKTLETADAPQLQGYFDLLEEEERLNKRYGHKEKFLDQSFFQMGRSINEGREGVDENTKAIKDFREENEELFEFLELHGITTMEAYNHIVESTGGILNGAGDAASDLADDIMDAQDVIEKFNGSREELFFGFKAGNLTGDLVRQVNQQGVDTLITTTSVLMTNVFNGLTIPEMADIVIEEIEGRGRLNGYNITTS